MTVLTGNHLAMGYRGAMTESSILVAAFELPRGQAIDPVVHDIAAPAGLVYELMAAIGQGPQGEGDGASVLSRDGSDLLCEFWTTVTMPVVGRRVIRTREAVRLLPPDSIAFRHLNGPVRGVPRRLSREAGQSGGPDERAGQTGEEEGDELLGRGIDGSM